MGYQPIEHYGVIGDLDTVALVGMDGSIDFMCFPEFNSPTIFAALLDHGKGGRFRLSPVIPGARQKQLYLPDSNILLTRFLSGDGVAEISDYMAIGEAGSHQHDLVSSRTYGSIVAAPTFGLPETIGGARNWDYRRVEAVCLHA